MEFFVAQALATRIYNDNADYLSMKPLRIEIAGFLVEFLSANPPQDILKRWLQSATDSTLRDNVLLLMARLGVNLSDSTLEEELAKDSEIRLAAELVQGSAEAFDQLYRRFKEPLTRYVAKQVRDHGLAEDIVIDVFINVFQRPDQLEQVSNIKSYLLRMAKNKIIDEHRRNSRYEYVSLSEIDEKVFAGTASTLASTLEAQETQMITEQLLTQALEGLSKTDQMILLSYNLEEREQLAKRLGISSNSLRMRRHRLREYLRRYLKGNG
jgi:RNA polymerase sigma-70 factor (ECF subfamily)